MIITNHMDLPQAFVEMAKQEYELADNEYRVTSIMGALRPAILMRRHGHEIEVDVADMIWLLFGTAVHNVLEHQKESDSELKEERLKIPVTVDGGELPFTKDYILSGKFDLYCMDKKRVTDYKTTSVWKIIYKNFDDWKRQLLIYAYMMKQCGFPVTNAEVVAILKDHNKRDAKYKKDYPKLPLHKAKFKFTQQDFTEIELFIQDRFDQIAVLESLPDNELPLCTLEERFNDGDKFAVMKSGRKTALRVLSSDQEAAEWIDANGKGDYIETRPGEDKKCNDYCFVSEFCDYYKSKTERELSEVF